jgi:membrane protein
MKDSSLVKRLLAIALEVKDALRQDNVPVASAGVAFFGFLAMFPALAATFSVYGLVSNPEEIERQIEDLLESSPPATQEFFSGQLSGLADASGLGFVVVLGIVVSIWTASAAIKHLIAALNNVYGFRETRGFIGLRGTAVLFTFGAILFLCAAVFGLAILPPLLDSLELGASGQLALNIVRFPVLILLMSSALSVLFNLGPNRTEPKYRVTTPGAIAATLLWIALSGALSIYMANVTKFSTSAGTLGAITALLLWLYVTAFAILLGAEVDASIEKLDALARADTRSRIDERYEQATRTDKGKAALGGVLLGIAGAVASTIASKKKPGNN